MTIIWWGCGGKRLWPAVNKYPESGLECLKATKKITNNTSSNQHLKFLTSWVWIKLWGIRHWNWEDAVCFVLFQLASGQSVSTLVNDFVSGILNTTFSSFASGISSTQALGNAATQQLTTTYNAATQSIPAAIQNATNSVQQYAASANATSTQAQSQVQACVDQANQNLSALNASSSK
jgi:hypothetical protein